MIWRLLSSLDGNRSQFSYDNLCLCWLSWYNYQQCPPWKHTLENILVWTWHTAAAVKSLQSCSTLCSPIDGSPPGSSVPGILQTRILKWVPISFSNACMHAKLLQLCLTVWPYGQQPTRLLHPRDSLGKNTGVGCHFLLPWHTNTVFTPWMLVRIIN